MTRLLQILAFQRDVLLFRRPSVDPNHFCWQILAYIVAVSWIVGLGRYWDHPNAYLWQYLGLGSVVYVFVLSLLLFLIVWPLRPLHWTYRNVLIFVGMSSLPAVLYAIPVELFMELTLAQSVNAWFLAIVAFWRVSLYVWFLRAYGQLNVWRVIVGTLMPLTLILFSLAALNLEHAVFNIMAGINRNEGTPNDEAYAVVVTLTMFSFLISPVALIGYLVAAFRRKIPATIQTQEVETVVDKAA